MLASWPSAIQREVLTRLLIVARLGPRGISAVWSRSEVKQTILPVGIPPVRYSRPLARAHGLGRPATHQWPRQEGTVLHRRHD
jgi:hypothetical protein